MKVAALCKSILSEINKSVARQNSYYIYIRKPSVYGHAEIELIFKAMENNHGYKSPTSYFGRKLIELILMVCQPVLGQFMLRVYQARSLYVRFHILLVYFYFIIF